MLRVVDALPLSQWLWDKLKISQQWRGRIGRRCKVCSPPIAENSSELATFVQVWHWTLCCTLFRGIYHKPWCSGAFQYCDADTFKSGLYQKCCYLCTRNVKPSLKATVGSCGISRDWTKNLFVGTRSMRNITRLLSKWPLDSYLSFQVGCNTFIIRIVYVVIVSSSRQGELQYSLVDQWD